MCATFKIIKANPIFMHCTSGAVKQISFFQCLGSAECI